MSHDGKRWCSQHQGYIADVGGFEKPVPGAKKRWICGRCNKEHLERRMHLTEAEKKNRNRVKL